MKKLLLLAALGLGILSINAQTAPADSVFQTPQNLVFTGSNYAGELQPNYEPGTGNFSVMITMTPKKTAGTAQFILSKGNAGSGNPGWSLFLESGTLKFRVCGATSTTGNYRGGAGAAFADANYLNTEVKIVATVDRNANKVDLFINGSNAGTVSGIGTPSSWSIDAIQDITTKVYPLQIGQKCDASTKFTGTVSNLKIYNRVLTTTEITDVTPPSDYTYTTNSAIELTGTNAVTAGNPLAAKFNPGAGSYTVLFAITPNQTSAGSTIQEIAGRGNSGSSVAGWSILEGEGYIGFRICGTTPTGNYRASARIPFPDATYLGKLVYGAAVLDRGTGKIDFYVNGSNTGVEYTGYGPTSNVIDPAQDITASWPFLVGINCSAANPFKGTLNNLAVYNRALSSEELAGWKQSSTVTETAQPASKVFRIQVNNKKVTVPGLKTFEVFSITGMKQNISLPLNNGVYILKTNESAQKFIVY